MSWFRSPGPPQSYVDPDALDYWGREDSYYEDLEPPHRRVFRPRGEGFEDLAENDSEGPEQSRSGVSKGGSFPLSPAQLIDKEEAA